MIKNLQKFRLVTQLLFLALTILSVKLFKPLPVKLTIFSISFLVGTYYCGWICSFGSLQSFIRSFGKKYIKKNIVIPEKLNNILLYFRYITLFFSLGYFITLLDGRKTFLGLIAGKTFSYTFIFIMISLLILSLFIDRPFCKYLCPEGARYGAIGSSRLFTITRNSNTCINCSLCDKNCPMSVKISNVDSVSSPHCISCGECIVKCPKQGTLSLKLRNFKDPKSLIFFTIGLYFLYRTTVFVLNRFGGM